MSRDTVLVARVSVSFLGQTPAEQTYRISCPFSTGDGSVTFVCSALTGGLRDDYFGVPRVSLRSAGPEQAAVTVRGTVDRQAVQRIYGLGDKPQFRNWMRILGRDPSGLVVQKLGDAGVRLRVGP